MMNRKNGMWISIEGCECSGKTTLINKIKKRFPNVVIAPEFSDSELGLWLQEQVRTKPFLLTKSIISNSLLFLSDYFEIQKKIISPAIDNNQIVISDRGLLSKIAVQFAMLESINSKLAEKFLGDLFEFSLKPDLSIILDNSEKVIYNRIVKRSGSCDQDRIDMNMRTNYLIKYFANEFQLSYKLYSTEEAEKELEKIIEEY